MSGRRNTILAIACGVALLVATTAVWTACETPLSPPYQLTQPRILAIRSTPPELLPDGSVKLDALVYLPPGSPAPSYSWSWCAAVNGTLQCSMTAAQVNAALDPDQTLGVDVDYDLGSKASAIFAYPVSPQVLQSVCPRLPTLNLDGGLSDDASPFDLDAGFDDAQVAAARLGCNADEWNVYVLLTVNVGSTSLQAVRQETIAVQTPSWTDTNPSILGLAPYTGAPTDAGLLANPGDQADGAVLDAGVGSTSPSGTIVVAAIVPVSDSRQYPRGSLFPSEDDAGDGEAPEAGQLQESLSLAWYAQGGELAAQTTSLPTVAAGSPRAWASLLLNQWTPPSGNAATQLVLVMRDDHGGVGWLTVPVPAGKAP